MYFTFAVSVFAVRLVSGGLADRIGRVTTALPGLVSALLGMLLLAAATPGPAELAYVGTALFGVGHGLVFPALMAWAVDRAEPRERGAALGSFSAFGDAGQAVGGYAIGRLVDAAGFPTAYLAGGALCLAGALALVQPARREVSRRAGRPPRG
jgi:MFS family permease